MWTGEFAVKKFEYLYDKGLINNRIVPIGTEVTKIIDKSFQKTSSSSSKLLIEEPRILLACILNGRVEKIQIYRCRFQRGMSQYLL